MAGRVEQHSPTGVRLVWQPGTKRNGQLLGRREIVSGEVKVHDGRPRPDRGDITVDPLRYQHTPRHLDPDTGLLCPQLVIAEQPPVEVGKPLRVKTVQ
jgi:hypothetical protein